MGRHLEIKPAVVRDRLRRARRLAGLTATEAWQKMGYKNAAQLSKMECETSTTPLNLNFIIKAAMCYRVSTDYLLGLSGYDDPDPKITEQKAVLSSVEHLTNSLVEEISELVLKAGQEITLKVQLEKLAMLSEQVITTFERMRKNNPKFDNSIRGGATLVKEIETLKQQTIQSKEKVARFQHSPTILKQFRAIRSEERQLQFDSLRGL